jgi:hypothetical protein
MKRIEVWVPDQVVEFIQIFNQNSFYLNVAASGDVLTTLSKTYNQLKGNPAELDRWARQSMILFVNGVPSDEQLEIEVNDPTMDKGQVN